MKNLKLENFGVQEMDAKEMTETTGGGFFGALLGFVVGVIASAFVTAEYNVDGESVGSASAESNWLVCGGIGAAFGSLLPF